MSAQPLAGVLTLVLGLVPWQPTIPRVDAPDVLRLVEARRGQVVVLNFWASWCPPCLEEFPDLVAVEKDYRARGVSVVSISADFPDRIASDLLPFLERHRPDFPVYMRETDDPERFVKTIDSEWDGRIPTTFFIDRQGRTFIKRFSKVSRQDLKRYLEALLEE